jgi:hypothetical protein
MLKSWLDENLPDVVDRIVRARTGHSRALTPFPTGLQKLETRAEGPRNAGFCFHGTGGFNDSFIKADCKCKQSVGPGPASVSVEGRGSEPAELVPISRKVDQQDRARCSASCDTTTSLHVSTYALALSRCADQVAIGAPLAKIMKIINVCSMGDIDALHTFRSRLRSNNVGCRLACSRCQRCSYQEATERYDRQRP